MQRPLFLTGMMGCGKTTVGRVVADELGASLCDLDARIERLFGATVPELFAERGEAGFREAESEALASLLAEPGFAERTVVVSTGGGAVLRRQNREAMDRVGLRIYLEVSVEELVRRLLVERSADEGARPLLADDADGEPGGLRQRVAELLAARGSIYRAGARRVDGHGDPAAVAARVRAAAGLSGATPLPDSEAV
ncbi:shikimate kinase [Paraliomyxa miuraensis]|uniref:shikimate kinase n=1 Tax=Paraliomyxa miuraensis TaxID=376150 RepID=UPI00225AC281|nr:shikimate kinase [Paraliomyxa miuraensis]MCX4240282.1 hypothetical protein [Paraliomyxa miuraensis]